MPDINLSFDSIFPAVAAAYGSYLLVNVILLASTFVIVAAVVELASLIRPALRR